MKVSQENKYLGKFEGAEAEWGDIAEGANFLLALKFHWCKFSFS